MGYVRSSLKNAGTAPKQGSDGAPSAWIDTEPQYAPAIRDLKPDDQLLLLTWLHEARRDLLAVDGLRLQVSPLEAIDGTPVLDLKPVL